MGTRSSSFCKASGVVWKINGIAVVRPIAMHSKARCALYPRSADVKRFPVPDEKVKWDVPFPEYDPVDYTAESVKCGPIWADVDFREFDAAQPKWNSLDGKVNRNSYDGKYEIGDKNPYGRTGLKGRGLLGRWGPNHAADPMLQGEWKRVGGEKVKGADGKYILQFIAVQRADTKEWALPGGMVDPGEHVNQTLKREFGEEAMNSLEASAEDKKKIEKTIANFFSGGKKVYKGYVDDPRNTDNSWMETVAFNFS
ncbi:hypothetical protein ScPMuIL_007060 [Solemya velum]